MNWAMIASAFMLAAGAVLMVSSIARAMNIRSRALTSQFRKWKFPHVLMVVFGLGCFLLPLIIFYKESYPLELVIGILFLSGAVLISMMTGFLQANLDDLEQEIFERKRIEDKLDRMSMVDELTGLYNRRGFSTLVENQLKLARRAGQRIMLLYADIDGLDAVNQKFGYQEGDMMLREASKFLIQCFRSSDIIARVGGDEFIIFLVHAGDDPVTGLNENFKRQLALYNGARTSKYKLEIKSALSYYDPEYSDSVENMIVQAKEAFSGRYNHLERELTHGGT